MTYFWFWWFIFYTSHHLYTHSLYKYIVVYPIFIYVLLTTKHLHMNIQKKNIPHYFKGTALNSYFPDY